MLALPGQGLSFPLDVPSLLAGGSSVSGAGTITDWCERLVLGSGHWVLYCGYSSGGKGVGFGVSIRGLLAGRCDDE